MERIVYLLGAGFSAPLGLPVISNFLEKSRDLFNGQSGRYSHFDHVFGEIRGMAGIKSYYSSSMFNIEEILSILEMRHFLEGSRLRDEFVSYIIDVIEAYTPPIVPYSTNLPSNWEVALFGSSDGLNSTWRHFASFVSCLFNLKFLRLEQDVSSRDIVVDLMSNVRSTYGIITLNYDLVLERVPEFFADQYTVKRPNMRFEPAIGDGMQQPIFVPTGPVPIAKLHGSIDSGVIVPPTWSKGTSSQVVPAWNLAHRLLSEATQLRMIGFSLPVADAYIKYLIKSAAIDNSMLKRVDVICLDNNNEVLQRYRDFITYERSRFASANTFNYLVPILGHFTTSLRQPGPNADMNWLDLSHDGFMDTYGNRLAI